MKNKPVLTALQKLVKETFELVDRKGEQLAKSIHILQTEHSSDLTVYRIYAASAHCFDVKKELMCDPQDAAEYEGVADDGCCYSIHYDFDGFVNPLNDTEACAIVSKLLKFV